MAPIRVAIIFFVFEVSFFLCSCRTCALQDCLGKTALAADSPASNVRYTEKRLLTLPILCPATIPLKTPYQRTKTISVNIG